MPVGAFVDLSDEKFIGRANPAPGDSEPEYCMIFRTYTAHLFTYCIGSFRSVSRNSGDARLNGVCIVMPLRRSLSAIAIVSLALSSTSVLAEQCSDPVLTNSAKIHSLNTFLLVGSLKCRRVSPEILDSYNKFVDTRRDMLAENSFLVSAHFINLHGSASGKIAFSNYESKLANQYSGRAEDPISCVRIGAYSRLAVRASESDLLELASAVAPLPQLECPVQPVLSSQPILAAADTFDLEPPGSGYDRPKSPSAAAAAEPPPTAFPATAPGPLPAAPQAVAGMAEQPPPGRAHQATAATMPPAAITAGLAVVQPASLPPAESATAQEATFTDQPAKPAPSAAEALAEAARALAQAAAALQQQGAAAK